MGPYGSHNGAGDLPTKRILTAEFTPTGYQKEDHLRSGDGLHEWGRDIEYGMVAVYEFDDIEYRSLDWARRVVSHCDGSGDTGVESVEEKAAFVCMRGCILLFLWRRWVLLGDQDLEENLWGYWCIQWRRRQLIQVGNLSTSFTHTNLAYGKAQPFEEIEL